MRAFCGFLFATRCGKEKCLEKEEEEIKNYEIPVQLRDLSFYL
jgi:hypothetical protein